MYDTFRKNTTALSFFFLRDGTTQPGCTLSLCVHLYVCSCLHLDFFSPFLLLLSLFCWAETQFEGGALHVCLHQRKKNCFLPFVCACVDIVSNTHVWFHLHLCISLRWVWCRCKTCACRWLMVHHPLRSSHGHTHTHNLRPHRHQTYMFFSSSYGNTLHPLFPPLTQTQQQYTSY